MSRAIILDVSDREPPEPLTATLESAARLREGEYLRMRHRRYPCLLFDNLAAQGFDYAVRGGEQVACEVLIWRRDDPVAARAAERVAEGLPPWRE